MKTATLLATLLLSFLTGFAQSAQPQVAAARTGDVDVLRFAEKSDNTTRYFLIEGSHDSAAFEVVGRLDAQPYAPFASL